MVLSSREGHISGYVTQHKYPASLFEQGVFSELYQKSFRTKMLSENIILRLNRSII